MSTDLRSNRDGFVTRCGCWSPARRATPNRMAVIRFDAANDAPSGGAILAAGTSDAVDDNFGDVEPNNTPSQATPLGTAARQRLYVGFGNTIGGTDTADYFVFEAARPEGMFTLGASGLCYTGSDHQLDRDAVEGRGGTRDSTPVGSWTSATGCATGTATLGAEHRISVGSDRGGRYRHVRGLYYSSRPVGVASTVFFVSMRRVGILAFAVGLAGCAHATTPGLVDGNDGTDSWQ